MITRSRKRKMEAHIGGDSRSAHGGGKEANPSTTQSVCRLSDAASGDSVVISPDVTHQFVTILTDLEEGSSYVHLDSCELGDTWTQKYPLPLSKYPAKLIRTGIGLLLVDSRFKII